MGNPEKSISPTVGMPLPASKDVLEEGENGGTTMDRMAERWLKLNLDSRGLFIDGNAELMPISAGLVDGFEEKSTDTCYKVPPSCICGKPHWAFRVKEQNMFQGVEYAEGSVVDFQNEVCSGTPSYGILGKEQEVQGMRLAAATEVDFHPNGKLNYGTLATPQNIDGLIFEGKIFFHENGRFRIANLAETTVIHDIKFGAGDTGFFEDGAVDFGRLAEDQVIQGIPCAKNALISFASNWQLEHARLAEDTVINGVLFRRGIDITFDKGKVFYAKYELESDTKVYGDVIPEGSTLIFDSDGIVTGISLSKVTKIQEIQCNYSSGIVGGDVEFYKNGRISKATLMREQIIRGKRLPDGTTIFFGEDGGMRTSF